MKNQYLKLMFFSSLMAAMCVSCNTKNAEQSTEAESVAQRNDWEELELKGKVKEVTIKEYRAHEAFGELQKDDLLWSRQYQFTADGMLSMSLRGQGTSEYDLIATYTYSDNERLIEYQGTQSGKEITTYTNSGDIKRVTLYNADGIEYQRKEYTYNEKNQLVEVAYYSKDNGLYRIMEYIYDAAGHVYKEKAKETNGEIDKEYHYAYDEQGRKIREEKYNGDGAMQNVKIYSYDKEGNIATIFDENQKICEYTYQYDSKGNYTEAYYKSRTYCSIAERTIVYY